MEGTIKKGTNMLMMATGAKAEVVEVGTFGAGQFFHVMSFLPEWLVMLPPVLKM